jgi:predicted metalloprotease with PDZ domain
MGWRAVAVWAAWLATAATPALAASRAVDYALTPLFDAAGLSALGVCVRLEADASGRTGFLLPGGSSVARNDPQDLRDLAAVGGELVPPQGGRVAIVSAPGAPISLCYRVVSGVDREPEREPMRPALRPTWFAAHGDHTLIAPQGRDDAPVRVRWTGVPAGWTAVSSLQFMRHPTVAQATDSYLLGGLGMTRLASRIGGQPLVFFYREGGWRIPPRRELAMITRVLAGDFAYWGDPARPLFTALVQVGHDGGGRGLPAGFVIFAPADQDLAEWKHVIAHEHTHNWISRQLGYLQDDDDREAWFKEGFTEAFASRSLVRAGAWTNAQFVDELNETLRRYAFSPERTASSDRIAAERNRLIDAHQLPYDRGHLLAVLWDRRLRQASSGRLGLDDVLQAQRRMAADNAAHGRQVSADHLFPLAYRQVTGMDLTADLQAYVEEGRLIELPADLFGRCGRFETLSQPVFDRGFDFAATLRDHILVGVVEGGPAWRAGLRDGQRIHMNERHTNDSRTALTYRVDQPDGSQRTITYLPQGTAQVSFQQFRLAADLGPAATETCRRMFAGLQ